MRVAVLACLVACYAPAPPAGAPCADNGTCPSGLTCVAGSCVTGVGPPADASDAPAPDGTDASPTNDRDHDGVADAVDNCPDTANPGQENEDGDRFGDACDPCPFDPDDQPVDTDGDGVADPCDPHPRAKGDQIVLFEGFHHGVPAGWQVGGLWTASGDDVVATNGPDGEFLVPPTPLAPHATVMAGVTIDDAPPIAGCDIQVNLPVDVTTQNSIDCNLFQNNTGRSQNLFDDFTTGELAGGGFAWTSKTPYILSITRGMAPDLTCTVIDAGSTSIYTADLPAPTAATTGGISAFGLTPRVSWLMIVTSP